MNVNFTEEELAFREEVRAFFKDKYPADIKAKQAQGVYLSKADHVAWQKALFDQGWAGINWPVEHGGTGWSQTEKYIYANEAAEAKAPRIIPFGLSMVAPVIYTYGNEEQKARFLPDILASNVWWCQGYSEPNSGSDLASLKTKAVRDGDHYIVSGTKTWTTLAQHADWIFCLVRTDDSGRKQEGISFLLIDMNDPGVTVTPIITIDGIREVNEVHFDSVRVPVSNLIGEEGKGWTYAKVLLTHERTGIARVAESKARLKSIKKMLDETPAGVEDVRSNSVFMARLLEIEVELKAIEYTELRVLSSVSTGKAPGPESSILKIKGSEIMQALDEIVVEIAGIYALPFVPEQYQAGFDGESVGPLFAAKAAPVYYNNRKVSIYGGTNEIQKNIIAKQVLGL
jgi:alkylation response protein AidB-like acyl-CoA dehydrogenase|tara:strand:- start:4865 stop:6061 length:1197 start_codon:yes stop_codon:yes gene_type:complete